MGKLSDIILANILPNPQYRLCSSITTTPFVFLISCIKLTSSIGLTLGILIIFIEILNYIQEKIKLFFPVHPRTKRNLEKFNLISKIKKQNILINEPVGFLEFLSLMENSKFILTDSGGIQEEASFLNIPVLTLRENTERPITVEKGTNTIVDKDFEKIKMYVNQILSNNYKKGQTIEKWDGQTAKRITKIIIERYLTE